MPWNWQQPDWPQFTWNAGRIASAEDLFLLEAGVLAGVSKHLAPDERMQSTVDAMTSEAVTTSEIEGEILDRGSVQSSIQRQLGLKADRKTAPFRELGVAEMTANVHLRWAEPLTGRMLFDWHSMLMQGRDMTDIGRYRRDRTPMQVVSGAAHAPRVHFEAPPSQAVPKQMQQFISWFEATASGSARLPLLTRSGIAHLYFVTIHPFEDGNGRIGRAISEKALAHGLGRPTMIALAATILRKRRGYYDQLEAANKCNEITEWLAWFAATVIEAQRTSTANVEFLVDKTRLLDRLRGQFNARQEKALRRVLREGPAGFDGGLSAANYAVITGASSATTTRDLTDLVEKGALRRTGERRHARYWTAIPKRPVEPVKV
ncbi:MAG: Fic family protein [Bryobacteraceae bacterium]